MTDFAKAYKYRVLLYKTVSTLAGLKNKITSTVCRGNVGTAPQTRGRSQQKKDGHYQYFNSLVIVTEVDGIRQSKQGVRALTPQGSFKS